MLEMSFIQGLDGGWGRDTFQLQWFDWKSSSTLVEAVEGKHYKACVSHLSPQGQKGRYSHFQVINNTDNNSYL